MGLWTLYYTSHEEIFHRYMAIFMRPRFEKLVIFIPLLQWLLFCCLCKFVSLIRNFLIVSKTWKLICIRRRTTCYRSDQAFSFKIYHSRFTPYCKWKEDLLCSHSVWNTQEYREKWWVEVQNFDLQIRFTIIQKLYALDDSFSWNHWLQLN